MKLTIIPADKIVIIDGAARRFDFTVNANYHAIQWDGSKGHIQTIKGSDVKLDDVDDFQSIIDAHAAILAKEVADKAAYNADPQRKVEKLSAYRYQVENGGVVVGGIRYYTDRESRATWNRIVDAAKDDASFVLPVYRAMNGVFTNITAAQILAADVAGLAHINKCFAIEYGLNLDDLELDQIEEAFDAAYSA